MTVGRVASWRSVKGWGTLWTPELPGKVWVHFGDIVEMDHFRELARGDYVAFEFEEFAQDGYSYRAVWVRRLDGADARRAAEYLRELARWQETGRGTRPDSPPNLDRPPAPRPGSEGAYGSTLTVTITYDPPSTADGEPK